MKSEFKPAVYAFVLLVSIVGIGIIGFMIIEGFSFIESFFMTIITVATVGFQEVHPLSDVGRIFTVRFIPELESDQNRRDDQLRCGDGHQTGRPSPATHLI